LEDVLIMATFVKGNFVKVQPGVDWKWDQWSNKHTNLCDKVCTVVDIKYESWVNQLFVEVESKSGERLWFLDHHLIIVDDYEEIYFESIHKACEQLQHHEGICKKLRDEILYDIFTPEELRASHDEKSKLENEVDNIFNDWEENTTKEIIPLPGLGGTMTNPPTPKSSADDARKKIRRIKSLGKKISKKDKSTMSGSLTSSWTLSDEELEELQDYIDSLPDTATSTTGGRDIDYGWDDQLADDWENDGNAD